ncbi:MAG: dihydrolipoamide succinyltransferase, partial [Gammaproteobacteria bacterium]|nr:dihydrolipoamide succinyltransferase [Gammaproteobacteria bacterium]
MMVEIKAPQFPESIADGEVATWHAAVGESVRRDQVLVDIETDKVVLEVVAPADGTLTAINKQEGDTVLAEEVLGVFEPGEVSVEATEAVPPAQVAEPVSEEAAEGVSEEAQAVIVSPAARKMADE